MKISGTKTANKIISQARLATMENVSATLRSIHSRWSAYRRERTARKPASVVANQRPASIVFATCSFAPCRPIGAMISTQTEAGSTTPT